MLDISYIMCRPYGDLTSHGSIHSKLLEVSTMPDSTELPNSDNATYEYAIANGLTKYVPSKPCKNEHEAQRYTKTKACCVCAYQQQRAWAKRHPEKISEYDKKTRGKAGQKEWHRDYERERARKKKEEINARRRQRRKDNPEIAKKHRDRSLAYAQLHKEELREKNAAYRKRPENREKARQKAKKWYTENKERHADWFKAYSKENPDKIKAKSINRRARQKNAEGSFTDEDVMRIRQSQKNKCAICKTKLLDKPRFIHLDHIVALAIGGANWPSNLQLLCQSCNGKKWKHDQIEFMQSLGYLL